MSLEVNYSGVNAPPFPGSCQLCPASTALHSLLVLGQHHTTPLEGLLHQQDQASDALLGSQMMDAFPVHNGQLHSFDLSTNL